MSAAHILVVEDEAAVLDALRELLESSGYRVTATNGARRALAALEREMPDLIVSDIVMPGMDGFAFYEAVRARSAGSAVPFIFLSARAERADVRAGKVLGVDDYITKPFEAEDLLAAIVSRLRRSAELDALRRREIEALTQQLATTLSHELRTPVAEVSAYAQLLEQGGTHLTPVEFGQLIHGLQHGVDRLAHLVEDVALLVDLRTGRARAAFEARCRRIDDVAALVRDACEAFARAMAEPPVRLVIDAPAALPPIHGDAVYLRAALARVLDNARKFSRERDATVRVAVAADAGFVHVAVADEGIGIAPAHLDTLCRAFGQVDRATNEQQGLGTGLAICRGVLDLHGGSVGVESRVGEGSTFTLSIPAARGEA